MCVWLHVMQLIIKSQDDQLEMIGSSVKVLKDMSHHIGSELDEQSVWVTMQSVGFIYLFI